MKRKMEWKETRKTPQTDKSKPPRTTNSDHQPQTPRTHKLWAANTPTSKAPPALKLRDKKQHPKSTAPPQ
jgi:hypothetical protein